MIVQLKINMIVPTKMLLMLQYVFIKAKNNPPQSQVFFSLHVLSKKIQSANSFLIFQLSGCAGNC